MSKDTTLFWLALSFFEFPCGIFLAIVSRLQKKKLRNLSNMTFSKISKFILDLVTINMLIYAFSKPIYAMIQRTYENCNRKEEMCKQLSDNINIIDAFYLLNCVLSKLITFT